MRIGSVYVVVFSLAGLVCPAQVVHAGDIEAMLASTDGSDAFTVADSVGTRLMEVESDGSIGIGTTAPGANLDVKGNVGTALTGLVTVLAGSDEVFGSSTSFTTELSPGDSIRIGNEVFGVFSITSDTSLMLDSVHVAGASNVTAFKDSDLLRVQNGEAVRKLVVTNSGNVGVGTTSPRSKLAVSGLPTAPPDASGNAGVVCVTNDGNFWLDNDGTNDCL